jgi:hypothetical protein
MDSHVKETYFASPFFVQRLLLTLNKTKVCVFSKCNENFDLNPALSGEHRFSWAVMPHQGHFLESDVPMAAYLYNSPLRGGLFSPSFHEQF